jgi:hypothetical protein
LRIDGIISRKLDTYISLLASSMGIKRFSYTQYLDIFRGMSEGVKDIIYAYYTNIHQNNLSIIIPQIGEDNLLTKYRKHWDGNDLASTVLRPVGDILPGSHRLHLRPAAPGQFHHQDHAAPWKPRRTFLTRATWIC